MYSFMLLTAKYGEEFKSHDERFSTYTKALKRALSIKEASGLRVKLLTQEEKKDNRNCFYIVASCDI